MKRLEKKTLSAQAAEVLLEKINSGEIAGNLPGENDLALDLNVSRRTVRGALLLLETSAVISKSERGKKRKVLVDSEAKAKAIKVNVLLPRARELMHPSTQNLLRLTRIELEQAGYLFQILEAKYSLDDDELAVAVEEVLLGHPADVWLVWEPSGAIADFVEENKIRAIGIGGASNLAKQMHMVYYETGSAIAHAFKRLFSGGHRYACFLSLYKMPEENYLPLFNHFEITRDFDDFFPIFNHTKEDLLRLLAEVFSKKQIPTAIICGSDQLLTVVTWLGKHGLRIPEDVSVVNIGYEAYFENMVPKISHYSTEAKPLVNKIKSIVHQVLERKKYSPQEHLMYTEFVEGESIRGC